MRKQCSAQVDAHSIEEAMEMAADYCLTHPNTWAAEIHNRAGFVLRISFASVRQPIAELRHITLSKYARPRCSHSNVSQLTLF